MRPTKLVMSGFCSYGGKDIVIPFDKLGKNGLYLISGETGAGKTTIFDAISFALFGEPSGTNRDAKMLRSDYANYDVPTEVELTFEYDGHEYVVKRNPDYEVKLPDGKIKKKTVDASLYRDGNLVCTKTKEVTNQIIDIIRLDKNQFAQIAMIAQGEFMKLITSSTKDRTEIFRKLFQTKEYLDVQESIKTETLNVKKDLDSLSQSVDQYLDGVDCDEESTLYAEAEAVRARLKLTTEALEIIKKIISEDKDKYEKNKLLDSENNKEIDELNSQKTIVENYKNDLKTLETTQIDLDKLTPQIDEATELKKEADSKKEEGLKAHTLAEKIKEDLLKYDALDALIDEINKINKDISLARDNGQKLEDKRDEILNSISKTEKEIESMKDIDKNLQEKTSALEKENEKVQKLDEINNELVELNKLEETLNNTQTEYKNAQKEAEEANKKYSDANRAYLNEQAGIMAQTLNEGDACPVCGSIHHPQLAKKSDKAPSEADLKNFENIAKTTTNKAAMLSEQAGVIKGNVQTKRDSIISISKALFGCSDIKEIETRISDYIKSVKENATLLEKELNDIGEKINKKQKLESDLPTLRTSLDDVKEEISNGLSLIAGLEADLKGKQSLQDKTKLELKFESKTAAKQESDSLEKIHLDVENAITVAVDNLTKLSKNKSELEGKIKQLKEQTKKVPQLDTIAIDEKLSKLQNTRNELKLLAERISNRISTNSNVLTNVEKASTELTQVESKYKWLNALSKTANGTVEKKERITFETFVQATYFDRVIRRANLRFSAMTAGQYQLVRSTEVKSLGSQTALDLNVIDHYSGKERDVKSLSGGESFMASLALALGLADEVTASAGGIKIDTMFIDEGFGSLDGDTLEEAMRALNDLAQSNCLVGIISHVDVLERRIDNKIVVKKDSNGSSSAIVVTA